MNLAPQRPRLRAPLGARDLYDLCAQALILADVPGVRASLSEQGAKRVGKDCNVEPVA
jgi:hypothetical protein